MEDWRPIPTFPIYEICEDGRVRNKNTGKYLKINWNNGVGVVTLYYKNRLYGRSVQRLLQKIFGKEKVQRNPVRVKCPICGSRVDKKSIELHMKTCEPRDPNIQYFEF